ncbi:M23 family metallopeptidase [Scrofimicrobium canadense]|nr:M23 family metallopeptidase [Scrofimicrobium canadense]
MRLATMIRLFALFSTFLLAMAAPAPRESWDWPVTPRPSIVRAFDPPAVPWGSGHRGVDLDVAVGSTVHAPADGTVIYAGMLVNRQVISILHRDGVRSTFEPVEPVVTKGQEVRQGDIVATVLEGHSPGALHWGAKLGPKHYVDPLSMLSVTMVLKPW